MRMVAFVVVMVLFGGTMRFQHWCELAGAATGVCLFTSFYGQCHSAVLRTQSFFFLRTSFQSICLLTAFAIWMYLLPDHRHC
jgi:hypothetical protein